VRAAHNPSWFFRPAPQAPVKMETPAQIVARHGCALVLDAASGVVQAGLLAHDRPPLWHRAEGDAGQLVFTLTERCLAESRRELGAVAVIYCEGPGSMLGTRTLAMTLRTWQTLQARPAYAYQSLALAAVHEAARTPGRAFALLADARRDSWHSIAVSATGDIGPLRRIATADLPAGELRLPENFRAWSKPGRAVSPCIYDVGALFRAAGDAAILRAVEAPDAFQHDAPAYKQWTPAVHQAPAPRP
jgi:tRNA threonylcarbamoyladenosine biosynthesis protein TsaB